jgi:hypothetical protein
MVFPSLMTACKDILNTPLEVVVEEEENKGYGNVDSDDPLFLTMANKKTSDITDFRIRDYEAEKERLERNMNDKKIDLKVSMTEYSTTRKDRREKQAEVDRLGVLEKVQSGKVADDIMQVNETCRKIDKLNLKYKYSKYLDEKITTPKFYKEWPKARVRTHSHLNTQEEWDALKDTPVEMLVLTHGHRCTNLGPVGSR